jgi:signal recognition particle receptor subunit beta
VGELMVLFNYSTKELTAKVVYYGPGLGGKTTNLQWVHERLPIKNKGKMLSLATETDRTLFFDFLPIELGTIRGMRTRVQLYTVPGQVFYNATRRMVLKGADCVVFVCDSQEPMLDANLESLENMRQNLEANEIEPGELPMVLQYNKRDLPNALPIEILNERLNPGGLPFHEAVAIRGQGVEETLKGATALVFRSLASRYGGGEQAASTPAPSAAPAAPAPVPAEPVHAGDTPPEARADVPAKKPGSATIPPLRRPESAVPSDDLLDSLELQVDDEELSLESLTTDPVVGAPVEDEEEIIDAEELGGLSAESETPFPEPPRAASPPPPRAPDVRSTLVSGPAETEELRSRLRRAPEPELSLDEFDDDEDVEEITLEESPPPSQPLPSPSVAIGARRSVAVAPITTNPVAVELTAIPGRTEVSIPVEVRVGNGTAQVNIHLSLTLNISRD